MHDCLTCANFTGSDEIPYECIFYKSTSLSYLNYTPEAEDIPEEPEEEEDNLQNELLEIMEYNWTCYGKQYSETLLEMLDDRYVPKEIKQEALILLNAFIKGGCMNKDD